MSSQADHPCQGCGRPHASHGIGFPARPKTDWYCAECFRRQPEGQAMFLNMIGVMADG